MLLMADDGKDEEKMAVDNEEEDEGTQDILLTVAELKHSYLFELKIGNQAEADRIKKDLMEIFEKESLVHCIYTAYTLHIVYYESLF